MTDARSFTEKRFIPYKVEFEKRVNFIKSILAESGVKGIVYGNSGGKDSALVGILCKAACGNTVGIILPCTSKRNYDEDTADAKEVAEKYNIETRTVDLTAVKEAELKPARLQENVNNKSIAFNCIMLYNKLKYNFTYLEE